MLVEASVTMTPSSSCSRWSQVPESLFSCSNCAHNTTHTQHIIHSVHGCYEPLHHIVAFTQVCEVILWQGCINAQAGQSSILPQVFTSCKANPSQGKTSQTVADSSWWLSPADTDAVLGSSLNSTACDPLLESTSCRIKRK